MSEPIIIPIEEFQISSPSKEWVISISEEGNLQSEEKSE